MNGFFKSEFESKIHQGSPDILLFQMFRDNWKNINPNAIETCTDFAKQHICDAIINGLVTFFNHELQKSTIRDDYRELIELYIIFLGGDNKSKIKIRRPGAIQQA